MSRLDLTGTVSPAALTPTEAITRDTKRRLGYATRAERKAWLLPKMGRCCFSRHLYGDRNLIERFFNKIRQFRRIATRYDKLAKNVLASLKLACIRIWPRGNGSTAQQNRSQ